jgi:hypothetical protein
MDENARQLNKAMEELGEDKRELAGLYLDRITQMQNLFEFAQVMINAILAQVSEPTMLPLELPSEEEA